LLHCVISTRKSSLSMLSASTLLRVVCIQSPPSVFY
jgi:hypothetical protein